MELTTVWFLLIALLWTGYLVLEGFDFGVGMLLPVLGRGSDDADAETNHRVMINTIAPVWDGNEVWLLVAGGATFAAFTGFVRRESVIRGADHVIATFDELRSLVLP